MKRILILLAVVTIAGVVAAACGDGDQVSSPVSGVGPGISIGEALNSDLEGPLLVNGRLHVQDGRTRLCEVVARARPPACSARFLEVEGLDLTTMDDLTSEGSVTWSAGNVRILGSVDGDVLTVSGTVR
jgi:hypothetical protein